MAGPGRPASEKSMLQYLNGSPRTYLGALVSTGSGVNNSTTALPFNTPALGPLNTANVPPINYTNTLAGKMLLLQPTSAGLILPANSAALTIAVQTTLPPLPGTVPGVALSTAERVVILMGQQDGWLQWMSTGGSGNLLVWELL